MRDPEKSHADSKAGLAGWARWTTQSFVVVNYKVFRSVRPYYIIIRNRQKASMSIVRVVKLFRLPSSLNGKWIMG